MSMPLDPALAALLPPPLAEPQPSLFEMEPTEARAFFDKIVGGKPCQDDLGVTSEDAEIASAGATIAVRIYRPAQPLNRATIVFLHGGGYMLGGLDQMDGEARLLCHLTGAVVVSVDYRLVPEHPLPAAHDDAVAALHWARAHIDRLGGDKGLLCVAGESAGANLAASAAIAIREEAVGLAAQLLIVPAPDFDALRAVPDVKPPHPMLTARDIRAIAARCLPGDPAAATRYPYSAAYADDLSGLPPAVIGLAGHCPTRNIGLAYADRLREAGNVVHVHDFADLFHPFFAFTQASPAARSAAETLCDKLSSLIASPSGSSNASDEIAQDGEKFR